MDYNRHKLRQQLIDNLIKQAEQNQLHSIKQGIDDPFQVYYYANPVQDPIYLQNLQQKIKQKLIEQANLTKMSYMKQQLTKQLYIINQQLLAQKYESQNLDIMIQHMQSKIKKQRIKAQVDTIKSKPQQTQASISVQTQKPVLKDASILCQQSTNEKRKKFKRNHLFDTQIYSITIKSQNFTNSKINSNTNKNNKQIQEKKQQKLKKQKQRNYKLIKQEKIQQKAIDMNRIDNKIQLQNRIASANQNIEQIYQDLQKQMRYMQHLKHINQPRKYQQQKQRVKFMIQLFWKYAPTDQKQPSDVDSNFDLPILQQI